MNYIYVSPSRDSCFSYGPFPSSAERTTTPICHSFLRPSFRSRSAPVEDIIEQTHPDPTRSLYTYLLGRVELSGCDLLCTRLVRNDPLLDLICRVVGSKGVHSECLQKWVARQVRLQFSPHNMIYKTENIEIPTCQAPTTPSCSVSTT